jgi:hypothetical protein
MHAANLFGDDICSSTVVALSVSRWSSRSIRLSTCTIVLVSPGFEMCQGWCYSLKNRRKYSIEIKKREVAPATGGAAGAVGLSAA